MNLNELKDVFNYLLNKGKKISDTERDFYTHSATRIQMIAGNDRA